MAAAGSDTTTDPSLWPSRWAEVTRDLLVGQGHDPAQVDRAIADRVADEAAEADRRERRLAELAEVWATKPPDTPHAYQAPS